MKIEIFVLVRSFLHILLIVYPFYFLFVIIFLLLDNSVCTLKLRMWIFYKKKRPHFISTTYLWQVVHQKGNYKKGPETTKSENTSGDICVGTESVSNSGERTNEGVGGMECDEAYFCKSNKVHSSKLST